jgi:hypothetical protein
MSIERVETICREFLLQSETPLVSVSQLYQHCIAEEAVRDVLTEEALLNFLRGHADVVVVEGVEEDAPVARNEFDRVGLVMGPRAILKSRMPTRDEMKNMFQMQLEVMRDALMQVLKHAKESQDASRIAEIEQALENTDSIGERLGDL